MKKISDVIVEGISLVTSAFTPAVAHATTKHAIFKTKKRITDEQKSRLEKCQQVLKKISKSM